MPSPFPGMDPYLETKTLWSDFHSSMIHYIREALQGVIRPKYNARVEERIHIIAPPQDYYPDVTVLKFPRKPSSNQPTSAAVMDEPVVLTSLESEFRELYIEIRHVTSGEIVTAIELLSPVNKTGKEFQKYKKKQQDLLHSEVNLVEIDLLIRGRHAVAISESELQSCGNPRYIVVVRPASNRYESRVWPFHLEDPLPKIGVPLREPDDDAVLDLGSVFERTYEVSAFDDLIDYQLPPNVTLTNREMLWLDRLLKQEGVRQSDNGRQNGS